MEIAAAAWFRVKLQPCRDCGAQLRPKLNERNSRLRTQLQALALATLLHSLQSFKNLLRFHERNHRLELQANVARAFGTHVYDYSDAIKENVSNVVARIASLQTAMVSVWQTLGPEAMAALDISPSDFDDYLTNLQIAKILNDDATELSVASIQSESWQDWFRRGFDNPERSFLRRIQATGHDEGLESASCNIEEQTAAS
ncbi:hypothetical protein R1sor_024331 [Riccia sorocarpa]|uniref:Uncharacterized protein n=1 Tax=Riccia sorocarpa TaxID=122646 RepID=A0ABD3GQ79_9MARC